MRTFWIGAALALLLAGPVHSGSLKIDRPMPDAELTLIDGSKVQLAELKGQVIILNFWATWCVPCRKELPLLDGIYRRLQPHGLRVFAITVDDSLPASALKPLFKAMAIPSVRKVKGFSTVMAAVPTNYVIDRNGIVRHTKPGAFDLDDINRIIVPLLNERAG